MAQALRLLGLKRDATEDEISSAYKKMVFKWHPDRHQGEAAKVKATEKFRQIQQAFETLTRGPVS